MMISGLIIALGSALILCLAICLITGKKLRLERKISHSLREEVIGLARELKQRDIFCSYCANAIFAEEPIWPEEEDDWYDYQAQKRAIEN